MVEKRLEVVGEHRRRPTTGRRMAEPAMVKGDYAIRPHQVIDLLPPGQVIGTATVREDDHGTVAVDLIINLGPIDRSYWHPSPQYLLPFPEGSSVRTPLPTDTEDSYDQAAAWP